MHLTGSIVALVTPFTQEGAIDFEALEALIAWHIEEGTDGIVLCGTTGESPTLTHAEKLALFERGVRASAGRIPIIAGVGTYNTQESVLLCRLAKEIGVSAALVIVPYYNRPTAEGCFLHYAALNDVGLPLIVYHHPGRTGIKLPAQCLSKIASLSQVIGIKECSCDLSFTTELLQTVKTPIFSGDDGFILPMMAMGSVGIISVIANVIPKAWKELVTLLQEGKLSEARALFSRYYPLTLALGLETNPQPIKYALSLLGRCHDVFRLPLISPGPKTKEAIAEALKAHLQPVLAQ